MNTPQSSRKVFVVGSEDRKQFVALDGAFFGKVRITESLMEAAHLESWEAARRVISQLPRKMREQFTRIFPVILTAQIEPDPTQGDININLNVYFPQMAELVVAFESARIALTHLDMRARIAEETKIGSLVLSDVCASLSFMMAEIRRAQRDAAETAKFRETAVRGNELPASTASNGRELCPPSLADQEVPALESGAEPLWLIQNTEALDPEAEDGDDPHLYWSNDAGWTHREAATYFLENEKCGLHLPIGGVWKLYSEVKIENPD